MLVEKLLLANIGLYFKMTLQNEITVTVYLALSTLWFWKQLSVSDSVVIVPCVVPSLKTTRASCRQAKVKGHVDSL